MARPKKYSGKRTPSSKDVDRLARKLGYNRKTKNISIGERSSHNRRVRKGIKNMLKIDPNFGRGL